MGELRQEVAEAHPLAGIQAPGGFIQNQYLRVVQQRLGDSYPALHPAGKPGNLPAPHVQQGDPLQQLLYPPPALPLIQPFQRRHIGQIVPHGEVLMKSELLGQEAENVAVPLPQHPDGDSIVHNLARVRL